MKVYVVMSWGVDDVPIGIFDDYELAKECAKRHSTGVYEMIINEEIEKKEFFKRGRNK
ncbi:MAG: hypothetical protein IJS58_01495 [Bacilli bacterium]|nr:hypothetical protein [Bacilli bacterium]